MKNQASATTEPQVSPSDGIVMLEALREEVESFIENGNIPDHKFAGHSIRAESYANMIFGEGSTEAKDLKNAIFHLEWNAGTPEVDSYLKGELGVIESLIEVLKERDSISLSSNTENRKNLGEKIFIVHGSNHDILNKVKIFLNKLDLENVVLHEQANQGKTIIEKFEDTAAGIGFAVVIMTKDDKGGTTTEDSKDYKHRARQNVIFELGFFLSKLGRSKVCVLLEEGVEKPSDYDGVLFIPLTENEGCLVSLAKEIKKSGIAVDLNKIVRD